jgi:hypothetical protein
MVRNCVAQRYGTLGGSRGLVFRTGLLANGLIRNFGALGNHRDEQFEEQFEES